ncbi:MAG: alpha/beta hydrolase [Eubacteriales bacterium]|nr:alpha/beta hydrolase [Eubacteriales bacterium]
MSRDYWKRFQEQKEPGVSDSGSDRKDVRKNDQKNDRKTDRNFADAPEITDEENSRFRHYMRTALGIGAAGTLAGAGAVFGCFQLARFTMQGSRMTLYDAMLWQSEHYDTSWFSDMVRKDYTIRSYDGYVLHVELVETPDAKGNMYVILSHGHADNRMGDLKYMPIYLELGYRCIIYDLRGHGENEEAFCTFGVREGEDLAAVIMDTYNRYGADIELGLHGESLGSAAVIESLAYQQDVSFVVCDCGFADIENVLKGLLRANHLPVKILDFVSCAAKVKYGYSFREMRPIDALPSNRVPILFIHGEDDAFIPPSNSVRMKGITAGYSELHLIPGAGHAESVLKEPELYKKYVGQFLDHLNQ